MLVILGQEVLTRSGHWLALGLEPGREVEWRYGVRDDAVEVWNGLWRSDLPWNADSESALAKWGRSLAFDVHRGSWRTAAGNSDAHREGQIGTPPTVVLADDLSAAALLTAVQAGRCWIAESAEVEHELLARSGPHAAGIGSTS